jgi:copper(I)-binding protein
VRYLLISPVVLGLCLPGCRRSADTGAATAGTLRIQQAFAFQPITRDEAAAYFEVRNSADAADTLIGAAADIAGATMIHGPVEGAGMTARNELPIPPHGTLRLEPGRLHLMLMNLGRIPKAGERFNLTLTFRHAGAVTFAVPVRPYGQ